VPASLRIYAIGDIHGRVDLLNELLARIKADIAARPTARPVFVFLGDYIDRGPGSRETIDRLIEHAATSESIFLKGNHEQIAIRCLSDRSLFERWMRLGGLETLISYNVPAATLANGARIVELQAAFHNALPQAHFRFFRDLQPAFASGDFVAGEVIALNPRPVRETVQIQRAAAEDEALPFDREGFDAHRGVFEFRFARDRIDRRADQRAIGCCLVLEAGNDSFQPCQRLVGSENAVAQARRNAVLNGLENVCRYEAVNAFDVLKQWSREGRQYDVVMLDPPAFTKSRENIQKAITGYKEINLRGMKLVKKGGFLVTSSCTNLVQPELFLETIQQAAKDAKRRLRQVTFQAQASDHPIVHGWENTNYLKFLIVQVL